MVSTIAPTRRNHKPHCIVNHVQQDCHLYHERDERMSLSPGRSRLLLPSNNAYRVPNRNDKMDGEQLAARKEMLRTLTGPSSRKGYALCKLCNAQFWGPNGKFL